MSPLALTLVLVAAVLHAAWNIVAKRANGNGRFVLITGAMTSVLWLPGGLWFGWQEVPRWGGAEWGIVATSAAVHLLYFRTLVEGYRRSDLTIVYPLARGSGPLLAALTGVLVLGEHLGLAGAAGVAAVCGGVLLIAGGGELGAGHAAGAEARRRARAGVRWGLLTGALIAAYSAIDAVAVKRFAIDPVVLDYFCNLLRVPLQLPLLLSDRAGVAAAARAQWRHALAVSVLAPSAYICVLYALKLAPLSHVAPAREVSLLVAALIGGRLLGEAQRGPRLIGAACIVGGVIALSRA